MEERFISLFDVVTMRPRRDHWILGPFMAFVLLSLFLPLVVSGNQPAPAWHTVDGRPIQFFAKMGFEFFVDDSMAHHYAKATVEISILIPDRFADSGLTKTFSSVTILNDELSTELGTHEHSGKKRVVLTISKAMAKKSKAVFYFRNNRKGVTHGSMYRIDLAKLVDDWSKQRK